MKVPVPVSIPFGAIRCWLAKHRFEALHCFEALQPPQPMHSLVLGVLLVRQSVCRQPPEHCRKLCYDHIRLDTTHSQPLKGGCKMYIVYVLWPSLIGGAHEARAARAKHPHPAKRDFVAAD